MAAGGLDWTDTVTSGAGYHGEIRGSVFRALDRWDHLAADGLNPQSVTRILNRVLVRSGVEGEGYSSHSLRRGFATWASRSHWRQSLALFVRESG
ncbi:hypothetical protein D9M71_550760 [compost metagenome]